MSEAFQQPNGGKSNIIEGGERPYYDSPEHAYLGDSGYSVQAYKYLNAGKRIDAVRCFLLSTDNLRLEVADSMKLTQAEFDEAVKDATDFVQKMPETRSNTELETKYPKADIIEILEAKKYYESSRRATLDSIKQTAEYFKNNYKFKKEV